VTLEELDPKGAEVLAHFRKFVLERFENTSETFHALDKFNRKRLRRPEFVGAIKSLGFAFPTKSLFCGLDPEGKKSIVEEDLYFLDRWKPPAFLTSKPSMQAADEFRSLLLKVFKNFLQAWRHFLDTDGSNRCSWLEFSTCCRKLNFRGDVPGAWRALDDDLSGYISLAEIDAVSSDTLSNFKAWADEEFGGVRSAFQVFDNDGSNEVSYREFRQTCRAYGFDCKDVKEVFQALDVEKNGTLGIEEVVFLDDWEFVDGNKADADADTQPLDRDTQVCAETDCTRYESDGPGPASYAFAPTIGAGPAVPMLRFSGAFSFRRRPQGNRLPGLSQDADLPSPVHYEITRQSFAETSYRSKPAFAFGSAPRMVAQSSTGPGPGSYVTARAVCEGNLHACHGPAATCSPRRPLRAHPLFKGSNIDRPLTVGSQHLQGGPWSARF